MFDTNEMSTMLGFATILEQLIPDGVQDVEVGGVTYHIEKKNGTISISSEEKSCPIFDDSDIKNKIQNFKQNCEDLSDCIFVEASEDIAKEIDIKTMSKLLSKESFTEEDAQEIEEMIDIASSTIKEHIENNIDRLQKLYVQF